MKLFSTPAAILAETNLLRRDEQFRREDRATVSNFFNGAPPLTDSEAQELGFTINVNHLFGYKELSDASDQVFGMLTKPDTLLSVELDAAPPGKRSEWGMMAAMEASRVLKKITQFQTAYQGICGDATMHGEALLFHPDTTFPLPKQCPLSRMLIPGDSSTDVRELTHFGIEHKLSVQDLEWYIAKEAEGWKAANLRAILAKIKDGSFRDGHVHHSNPEESEYRRQENSGAGYDSNRRRPGVEVVYFYQQRADLPGCPYDLSVTLNQAGESEEKDNILYEREQSIGRIETCLHPFFMDCIIGGAPKWHRVLGLGPLNYQLNHAVELLVNRAQQATMEGSMNLWTATNTATREAAQQIVMKHNGVLPEGINLVPNRFAPNFGGILEMIQFFRQAGSRNARGVTPNNGQGNDQLEVQAIAEMNQGAAASSNRTATWYSSKDRMWSEAFARLANCSIDPHERGYSEAMDFQGAMRRRGIPLWWLQRGNVEVKAIRLVGDGLRHKELSAVQFLTANRAQYAPEVQPRITRLTTALALDDYRLAEELTPIQEEPDSPQLLRADSENAVMLTQRSKLTPKADDIDELHVMQHFPALELLVSDALQYQKATFTPQQAQAFQVVGGHIVAHVQRIEGRATNQRNDPEREKARAFMDQLNQMASMGDKLVKNMEQGQQGQGQEEMDPVEMAKLELQSQALALQREKLAHNVSKFERTQGTREQAMAFEQNLKLEKDHRDNRRTQSEAVRSDVETSLKIASLGAKGQ